MVFTLGISIPLFPMGQIIFFANGIDHIDRWKNTLSMTTISPFKDSLVIRPLWWRSCGQRAWLLLWWSEFEYCSKENNFSRLQYKKMVNQKFHWLCQIGTTLCKFHWWFWIFLDAIAKVKKLICKSIAHNLKRVSLTKSFLALAMVFDLLLSNPT